MSSTTANPETGAARLATVARSRSSCYPVATRRAIIWAKVGDGRPPGEHSSNWPSSDYLLPAGYWGFRLIAWIHCVLGAVAVLPWNPKRHKNRSQLPPTWIADELGKRSSIERFFGRIFSLFGVFRLQRPPPCGWSAVATQVALVYTATVVVGLAAQRANRPDLIRSPKRVVAHLWAVES